MGKYFGTDGIRGIANETLTPELAYRAGCAAAVVLTSGGVRPRVVIGKDTRISCDMLEASLTAGLCAYGVDVTPLGVVPTPAVAYIAARYGADMGVVISASHNPHEHNGIKMFSGDGYKIPDAMEEEIERLIDSGCGTPKTHGDIGRVLPDGGNGLREYIEHLASLSAAGYTGRIAVDCANGAASATARQLFTAIGADFEIISDAPDGVNINAGCGSTHMEQLTQTVLSGGFNLGVAFDGDADRCLIVDECGEVIDGDMIMAICASAMLRDGTLRGGGIVGTVVSNAGMDTFADGCGISFLRADVGDRNVLELMQETGCNLGGESSGHAIFLDDATTGDGQLTAVKFISVLVESGVSASRLAADIPRYPQVMPGVAVSDNGEKERLMAHPAVAEAARAVERELSGRGRVLIRPSGTEALIRVLVEAETVEMANNRADYLINLIKSL